MIMRIQARLLQALKPWNWRSRRQSRTRKELVTSTAAKPWTHQLVSSILRSLPRFFFNSPLSIASGKEVSSQNNEEILGNGLTPSAADVAVYADLHSSVAKTAMMLRRRFLGKLPKPSLLRKVDSTHERLKKMMVHPLVTTTIASQIHPSSPGSCSHRKSLSLIGHSKEISCRSRSGSRVGAVSDYTSDGVADSVFEVSMVEDPVKVAAEVKLCGK
ncbi:hypothetical protein F2Q69_00030149 [Brassica cretica]|uniref:Uncharacterized protein n=1 Tax=Brassica cretica TaxID=69181 RepID=A0A8S9S8W0_BRACR|nr:hypothetical protein F2Q69_00030149 [Brassica cretica]